MRPKHYLSINQAVCAARSETEPPMRGRFRSQNIKINTKGPRRSQGIQVLRVDPDAAL